MTKEAANNVNSWLDSNKKILNLSHTKCMMFETNRTSIKWTDVAISFRNEFIDNGSCMKFLGVSVEQTLNSYTHKEELCMKMAGVCYNMKVLKKYVSISTSKTKN